MDLVDVLKEKASESPYTRVDKFLAEHFWSLYFGRDDAKYWVEYSETLMKYNDVGVWSRGNFLSMRSRILTDIGQQKRIILVGHSQGNFFVNSLYNDLLNSDYSYEADNCIGSVGIASPLSNKPGMYFYVTNTKDLVINAIRLRYSVLGANIKLPYTSDDKTGHQLYTYLERFAASRDAVSAHIWDHLDYLNQTCFYKYNIDISVDQNDPFYLRVENNDDRDLKGPATIEIIRPDGEKDIYNYPRDNLIVDSGKAYVMNTGGFGSTKLDSPDTHRITLRVRDPKDKNKILAEETISHAPGADPDPEPCPEPLSTSGGIEGYDGWLDLGEESGWVYGMFEAFLIPDNIAVFSESGRKLWSTAQFFRGRKEVMFHHDPDEEGRYVRVQVYAKYTNTEWELELDCPSVY